jgi:N6-L-threonylcarbamoyladenine synthase
MISLGIESTAHTFGIGVVSGKGEVLSNAKDAYVPPPGWGIKPDEAREHHQGVKEAVLEKALQQAGIGMDDIGVISFSAGPGLAPCLYVGFNFARELSERYGKPLVPVNHCIAHIEIGRLDSGLGDPVTLYVSGGNTQVIAFTGGRYRIFGETQDIGIGNALDKLGRGLGLGFPAGPRIEELAAKGKYLRLPYVVKGMDLSFSGIVTECLNRHGKGLPTEDVCHSFQETCFAMLTEVTERAMAHTGKGGALLTGGVAANRRLQDMLGTMCRERGGRFAAVPKELAGDNGAMIAWTGLLMQKSGGIPPASVEPRQRTDDVEVTWIG